MNLDPGNVRNQAGIGGGGLYDIGCYPIVAARFLFGGRAACGWSARSSAIPSFGTDRLASALLDVPGRPGAVHLLHPARALPADPDLRHQGADRDRDPVQRAARPALPDLRRRRQRPRRRLGRGRERSRSSTSTRSRATRSRARSATGAPLEFPLEDAVANMRVIDAVFRSGPERAGSRASVIRLPPPVPTTPRSRSPAASSRARDQPADSERKSIGSSHLRRYAPRRRPSPGSGNSAALQQSSPSLSTTPTAQTGPCAPRMTHPARNSGSDGARSIS